MKRCLVLAHTELLSLTFLVISWMLMESTFRMRVFGGEKNSRGKMVKPLNYFSTKSLHTSCLFCVTSASTNSTRIEHTILVYDSILISAIVGRWVLLFLFVKEVSPIPLHSCFKVFLCWAYFCSCHWSAKNWATLPLYFGLSWGFASSRGWRKPGALSWAFKGVCGDAQRFWLWAVFASCSWDPERTWQVSL